MDILGIGFPELILIFIIALMVFGPRRLPEMAVKVGRTITDLRNMSQGLLTEWQREITVAARLEELEKTRQEFAELKQEINQTKAEVTSETTAQVEELKKTGQELAETTRETQRAWQGSSVPASSEEDKRIEPPAAVPQSAPPAIASVETVNE